MAGVELYKMAAEQAVKTATYSRINRAIEGKITNNLGKVTWGLIKFKLFDKEGCRIGEAMDACDNIAPGETWHYKAFVPLEGCVTFEIESLQW